ncbi:MAG: PD-(D/E)XK nuclease family protein, partial [Deltaproteobacteria bacterium]|nr:PD-(D/E)XK nuclease family protein [Deltaproteobacteria bacterium]
EIISITLNRMRAEFRSSRAKNYWKKPKTCALFEHEYGVEVTDQQWKEMAQNVETCLRNFYASDIYIGLKSHGKDGWLEVEEFSSFHLDNININLAIDCAVQEGNSTIIYDWKTGKASSEDLSIQLACYAFYAMEKWNFPPDSLQVVEYNLPSNKANSFSVTMAEVEGIKGYIRGSIKDMQSLLKDPENNIPLPEEQFSKVENERVSLRCNFRKVCRI